MSDTRSTRSMTLATATWDPGAIVKRGDNYNEPLADWQTRAVRKHIADVLESLRLHDNTGDPLDEGYMNALGAVAAALQVDFHD